MRMGASEPKQRVLVDPSLQPAKLERIGALKQADEAVHTSCKLLPLLSPRSLLLSLITIHHFHFSILVTRPSWSEFRSREACGRT